MKLLLQYSHMNMCCVSSSVENMYSTALLLRRLFEGFYLQMKVFVSFVDNLHAYDNVL